MRLAAYSLTGVLLMAATGTAAQEQTYPNTFTTLTACTEALQSGRVRFYEPKYFGLRGRNPVDGVSRIVVPLESDTCLEMLVVGGRQFVAQREGTLFRAYRYADGSLSLYARDDCGNPVYGVVYAPQARALRDPVVLQPTPPAPAIVGPEVPVRPKQVAVPVVAETKSGFCSSKKCRWTVAAVGGAAAGYAAWRLWPCPPGTRRR